MYKMHSVHVTVYNLCLSNVFTVHTVVKSTHTHYSVYVSTWIESYSSFFWIALYWYATEATILSDVRANSSSTVLHVLLTDHHQHRCKYELTNITVVVIFGNISTILIFNISLRILVHSFVFENVYWKGLLLLKLSDIWFAIEWIPVASNPLIDDKAPPLNSWIRTTGSR